MATDDLVLESAPLHTEEPQWAAHAPAQVRAACERGAHAIGLTETRHNIPQIPECFKIARAHGYEVFTSPANPHRNVTLLVKKNLHVIHHDAVVVHNNYRVGVTFDFHGSHITVYVTHWEPTDNGHKIQSESLIKAMKKTSAGSGLSFYMGDTNPHPKPQSRKDSLPNKILIEAGMPPIWEVLNHYPSNIGVNVIGHNLKDTRVKALHAETHPALGSDHIPATATYAVTRRRAAKKVAPKA